MPEEIQQRLIEQEMSESYVDYSMSVIISRALPDVRDGLKPVHRRILYTMHKMGLLHNKPTKKCARITGDVMGRYHPHGDAAVYDALVRMAQDFSLRYPLIEGQGNFGASDFAAAASRYTEAKLAKVAEELLFDIDKDTVEFVPNYDNTLKEPVYLPAKLPNLLINGSSGIAVGMATNIPPHNISEVIDASIKAIDNPNIDINELLAVIKGPDFPTGGMISGIKGIHDAYKTGRGKIIVKSKVNIEGNSLVVTEIPYMVNKTTLIEEIVSLVKDKVIEDISDIRDESDREGIRLVIELKKSANPNFVLNQLFAHSSLKTTFGVIMLGVINNQPVIMNLKDVINYYIQHRKDVVTRRTSFELRKSEERAHILQGLQIALDNIDPVIKLIKSVKTIEDARNELIKNFNLTDIQANAILDMKLQRLTSLETTKLKEEYEGLIKLIQELKEILSSEQKIYDIIKKELIELKEKYGDKRRTEITFDEEEGVEEEELIKEEDVVITLTHSGYIKQIPLTSYKQQKRGGIGVVGTEVKEEDIVKNVFVTSNRNYLLIFTNKGKVHWLKAYQIPEGSRYSKGKPIINLIKMGKDEKVNAILTVSKFDEQNYIMTVTKNGLIKKTSLSEYSNPRSGGIIGINLKNNDEVVEVKITDGNHMLMIASKNGMAVKFNEKDVRSMGRNAAGVRGIKLVNDEVIGMETILPGVTIFTMTEKGYGKRTKEDEYRLIKRGGKGVTNIKITDKNGKVVGIETVNDNDDLICMTKNGIVTRIGIKDVSVIGRNTQGVRIMKLKEGDKVTSVAVVERE